MIVGDVNVSPNLLVVNVVTGKIVSPKDQVRYGVIIPG